MRNTAINITKLDSIAGMQVALWADSRGTGQIPITLAKPEVSYSLRRDHLERLFIHITQ